MRRITYILCLLMLLLGACRKESGQRAVPVASDVPIEFGVPQTKGADPITNLELLSIQKFSVSAWYTPEGETFGTESSSYIQNHCFGFIDPNWCGVTTAGDADPVYYPLDGTLTYFCYAPYRSDVSENSDITIVYAPDNDITSQLPNYLPKSPLICFTPSTSPANQIDFIAAVPILDVNRSQGTINLDFTHHLTTNIQFWFKYSGDLEVNERVMISQIIIRDVIGSEYLYFSESDGVLGYKWCSSISPVDGTSSMPVVSYTLSTDNSCLLDISASPYLDANIAKHVNTNINGKIYLLPQVLPTGACLEITYNIIDASSSSSVDENIITIPIYGIPGAESWQEGKTVKYTITIPVANHNNVEISTSVTDWADSGNSHAERELMY